MFSFFFSPYFILRVLFSLSLFHSDTPVLPLRHFQGDFGLASTSTTPPLWTARPVGTVGYMAPEIHELMETFQVSEKGGQKNCNRLNQRNPNLITTCHQETSDVWSAGVVLFIMLYGVPPFGEINPTDWWYDKIKNQKWTEFFTTHKNIYSDQMISSNSCYPCCTSQVQDVLQRMLCVDPKERITFDALLQHPWFTENNSSMSDTAIGQEMKQLLTHEKTSTPLFTLPSPPKTKLLLQETKTVTINASNKRIRCDGTGCCKGEVQQGVHVDRKRRLCYSQSIN